VWRHIPKLADLLSAEVALEFSKVAPVRLDCVAGEAALDADIIEIALDESVGVHFGDHSQ
jgi:hypothetical protein